MRVAVFGSSGQTGIQFVSQALENGHEVRAIVRDVSKITIKHDKLQVVCCDIFNEDSVDDALKDQEAVVSCLGFPKSHPVTGYSESMKCICSSMRKNGISRLVAMTAWYTDTLEFSGDKASFIVRWMLVPFIRPILEDMRRMELQMQETFPDLDYTIVRPPGLRNKPKTELPISVAEDFAVNTGAMFNATSRADVARFMLSCLDSGRYKKKMVAITTTPQLSGATQDQSQ